MLLAICRVSVFEPGPLQWICRELVQKLGSDEALACFGGEKYTESDGLTSQGERALCPRTGTPNSPRITGASLFSLGLLASFPFTCFGWSLLLYIPFFQFPTPVILACRGQGRPRQYILAVWIPFIRPRALLPPRRGPWAWNGMGRSL